MKLFVAIILAIVSFINAERPILHGRTFRQTSPDNEPYPARGFRPNGPQLNLPQRQATPRFHVSAPSQEYGPPQTSELPTTTELTTTTEAVTENSNTEIEAENIALPPRTNNQKSSKIQKTPSPTDVYVFAPHTPQKLFFSAPLNLATTVQQRQLNTLLAEPGIKPAPLQAVPALAKIQKPSVVQYYSQLTNVQPYLLNSYSQNTIITPYSASFVQVYQ